MVAQALLYSFVQSAKGRDPTIPVDRHGVDRAASDKEASPLRMASNRCWQFALAARILSGYYPISFFSSSIE
jgi:hypothetical protein